jgi:transcriptional regulator with PAS, ATPase and Fis domain
MSGSLLILSANDPRLAGAIQAYVQETLGLSPLACTCHGVREHLGNDADVLLLLAAPSPADGERVIRVVQEVHLAKLPPVFILNAGDAVAGQDLASLDPSLARRLRWPEEADTLCQLIRERLGRRSEFTGTREATIEEVLRRRFLAQTPSLLPLAERIALAAGHDINVLLTGETGTGKTFLARLIHECSPRKDHPFLVVPCGALAADLVQSEFFGHVKGAFTGADRAKEGKLAAVGQGTLLLDEIDTLAPGQQAALLRAIETGEYEPVGSNQTRLSRGRVIAATNLDPEEAVRRGQFREDLYYRLNVMAFSLPPLRERWQDVAPLVRSAASRFSRQFRKDLLDIQPEALAALESFPWPGNIRQLENVVQQAVLVSRGPVLLLQHLPPLIRNHAAPNRGPRRAGVFYQSREGTEREVIRRALETTGKSVSRCAQALGISRLTLNRKMKKYGLEL